MTKSCNLRYEAGYGESFALNVTSDNEDWADDAFACVKRRLDREPRQTAEDFQALVPIATRVLQNLGGNVWFTNNDSFKSYRVEATIGSPPAIPISTCWIIGDVTVRPVKGTVLEVIRADGYSSFWEASAIRSMAMMLIDFADDVEYVHAIRQQRERDRADPSEVNEESWPELQQD